jgi:radical SAM superfamily enzyme YgiQ (UPF0313 family)
MNTVDMIIFTGVSAKMPVRSIGAYAVAHAIRKTGRSVQVIDFTDWFTEEELLNTAKRFIGPNTKFIGVSSTFYQSEDNEVHKDAWMDKNFIIGLPSNVVAVVKKLKEEHSDIKFLLGGANSHYFKEYPFFDAVFHSYSDESIIEYIENNHRLWPKFQTMSIVEGEDHVIDVEHLTHRWEDHDFIFPGETLPLEISRGCIFKCKFCNFQLTGKSKLDHLRDSELIKDELLYNYEKFGTTNYTFADDTFNDSTVKLERLHKVVTSLPFKINFTTYMRLDLLYAHREQIQLVKEIGLRSAFFGIESYNPETAKLIGKGMASNKVKDFLLELRNDHFKENINFVCSFILGLPREDLASMRQTSEWNKLHDINSIYLPLFIRSKARYKSDIDSNYEKYGYTLESNGQSWTNEYTNFSEVLKLSMEFNKAHNCTLHTWFLFSFASLGIRTIDELQQLRFFGNPPEVEKEAWDRLAKMMSDYKKKINGQI